MNKISIVLLSVFLFGISIKSESQNLRADGDADKLSESHLYFSNKNGDKVCELPYKMKEEFEKPVIKN